MPKSLAVTVSALRFMALIVAALVPSALWANSYFIDSELLKEGDTAREASWIAAPFALYSDYTDWAYGVGGVWSGYGQDQQSFAGAALKSANQSEALWFFSSGTQLPFSDRLFLDTEIHWGWWRNVDLYRDGNPNFPLERAGSNSSSQNNFVRSFGEEGYARFKFEYVLPLGASSDSGLYTYRLKNGALLPESNTHKGNWNPLNSGRTIVSAQLFQQRQSYDQGQPSYYERAASGIHWMVDYDNTDMKQNPTQGSRSKLIISRDWGGLGSDGAWTRGQLDHAGYVDLGATKNARSRVLAFNFWTSDVLSWADNQRPPRFERSALGGWKRMRAYSFERFNDRSAIYYGAEYRYTPSWNPLPDLPLINLLPYFHWQWVGFAELGRVHNSYNFSELHKDMKWSLGAGLRLFTRGAVVRIDTAFGEEGGAFQVSANHPF